MTNPAAEGDVQPLPDPAEDTPAATVARLRAGAATMREAGATETAEAMERAADKIERGEMALPEPPGVEG